MFGHCGTTVQLPGQRLSVAFDRGYRLSAYIYPFWDNNNSCCIQYWLGGWQRPLLGAGMKIGFDILTLYFLFIAAGYQVGLGVLLTGYEIPILLGKMVF